TPSVKVVDAFGRERIDELPIPIANGRAGAKDIIRSSSSAKTPRTLRASSKSKIRIVDAMGSREGNVTESSFVENSSVLHDNTPICRTGTLSQIQQTLWEWAGRLMSDEDRLADDLALNTTHLKELEEVSRTSRHAQNQLARALRVESVKEHDLMHKYAKDAMGRSGLLVRQSAYIFEMVASYHSRSRLSLVAAVLSTVIWFGLELCYRLFSFVHVQALRLFCTVYYDPLCPELNPLPGHSRQFLPPYPSFLWSLPQAYEVLKHEGWIALKAELQGAVRRAGERAWESWTEPPNAGTWSPTRLCRQNLQNTPDYLAHLTAPGVLPYSGLAPCNPWGMVEFEI
ncbi:uncharacterized protein EDB91DRAFT_1042053, partial [Suillus paluster]|uniref:uncharacterized protein n=1 Tax=Suillus paluster TaxID=48578 RepID=UPI001B86BA7B